MIPPAPYIVTGRGRRVMVEALRFYHVRTRRSDGLAYVAERRSIVPTYSASYPE